MRTLVAVAVAILSGACAGGPGTEVDGKSEEPLLAFYLTPDEQRSRGDYREFQGRGVYLGRQPVISDPDVLRVDANLHVGGVVLDVELRPDAAERTWRITSENIGRELAILFNSEIVSVSVIRTEIDGRAQMLLPATSSEEAERYLELIRARWPSD